MKREYKKPSVAFIDYSYDEQVVAESHKVDGFGDGYQVYYCTFLSTAYDNPCSMMLSSTSTFKCDTNAWSLRR